MASHIKNYFFQDDTLFLKNVDEIPKAQKSIGEFSVVSTKKSVLFPIEHARLPNYMVLTLKTMSLMSE